MNKSTAYFTAGVVSTLTLVLIGKWFSFKSNGKAEIRKRVLFFGDSITQHGFNPKDGWVSNLAYWWSRRVDILNRGFSGYNTKWGVKIVNEVVIQEQPDFVFVFFGANDSVDKSVVQHVPIEEYSRNTHQIVKSISEALPTIPIVLITAPPVWELLLEETNKSKGRGLDRNNDRTLQYVTACKDVGKLLNVPVLDLWTKLEGASERRQDYLIDGLHLNDKGNVALFKAVQALIKERFPNWVPEMMPMHMPEWSQIASGERSLT